jgi:hypothetical protein
MIRIFRRIRGDILVESKSQKYLFYAVGEVFLVIVGILIALQVNNWNEERIEQQQVKEYAQDLISDLERDIAMVGSITRQIQLTLNKVGTLSAYARRRELDQLSNLDLYFLISAAGYRPYQWNRSTMDQLKSSGALRKIESSDLVKKITTYDSLTHHLDEDYMFDRDLVLDAMKVADEIIDSSYLVDDEAMAVLREVFREPYSFPPTKLYELYKDTDLQLLTDDASKLRVLANKYDHLGGMRARSEAEIPRLVENARDLIELLNAEYSE